MMPLLIKRSAVLLSAVLVLSACRAAPPSAEQPSDPSFPDAPAESDIDEQPSEGTSATLPDDAQIYQDADGMFALALPANYTYESVDNGLMFESPDGGFNGRVTYLTEEKDLSQEELESRLKQILEEQLGETNWQNSGELQPDGSLRLDWTGTDTKGNDLDAISFIEQHGNTLFILNIQGVNQAYLNYNDDARIIVGSYVVRREPAAETEPNDSDA